VSTVKEPAITSAIDPDLGAVKAFIADMIAKGAIATLIAAIVGLLVKMRELNTELMKKLASKSRKRPPNEAMRRLQMELPLLWTPAANDAEPALPPEHKPKRRGAKVPKAHGRPQLPAHLPRVPDVRRVAADKRTCPHCHVEVARICIKTTAEKLDVRPSEFIVLQTQLETCSCPRCHQYVVTADKGDEVLDRGILGNELLVQALVDHYDDAVPWERMERNARQEDVPLAANTVASSVGRVIDLFDPIVRHIRHCCLSSSFPALDATRMPVLDPLHPLGIKSGALWLIEGDPPLRLLPICAERPRRAPEEVLRGTHARQRDVRRVGHQQLRREGGRRQTRRVQCARPARPRRGSSARRRSRRRGPRSVRQDLSRRRRVQTSGREHRPALRAATAAKRAPRRGAARLA
jgi:transposase